jgi:hypothetical protein
MSTHTHRPRTLALAALTELTALGRSLAELSYHTATQAVVSDITRTFGTRLCPICLWE